MNDIKPLFLWQAFNAIRKYRCFWSGFMTLDGCHKFLRISIKMSQIYLFFKGIVEWSLGKNESPPFLLVISNITTIFLFVRVCVCVCVFVLGLGLSSCRALALYRTDTTIRSRFLPSSLWFPSFRLSSVAISPLLLPAWGTPGQGPGFSHTVPWRREDSGTSGTAPDSGRAEAPEV